MKAAESLSTFSKDLRYAARQLRRTPLFALVAVVTLALGIGANTAVFSVMNAVILRYLPVPDPQQLALLHYGEQPSNSSQTGYDDTSLPENVFEAMRTQTNVFSDVLAFVPLSTSGKIAVRYGTEPEEAAADEVSGNFFTGLGVTLARGRGFTVEDEKQHAAIAVLSYNYWTRRFARNPSVLGQTLYIKGIPFSVVGIAPPEFSGLERTKATDIWVPFQINPNLKPWGAPPQEDISLYGSPRWFFLMMMGRLRPGVTLARAQAQLSPVYQQTVYHALGQPKAGEKPSELTLTNVRGIEGEEAKPLFILMAMVGLVLMIACGNVAMLLVARNAAREREFSLRMALGAGRTSLFRQLLSEGLILVLAGASLGWAFALAAIRALSTWSSVEVALEPDKRVLLFTIAISALAALAFGLAPLRNAAKIPTGLALKSGAAGSWQGRSHTRTGQAVIALQISLCLMLLVGSGLLVRSLRNLQSANLGMHASGLLVFGIEPPMWAQTTLQQAIRNSGAPVARADVSSDVLNFYRQLVARLRTLPAVESATMMGNRLGSGWSNNTGVKVDGAIPGGKQFAPVRWNPVGPDYFHVLQIPLSLGRDFTDADSPSSAKVCIVNQTFVTRYLNGQNPVGHRIQLSGMKNEFVIVGLASDSKYTSVRENPRPMAYVPYTQIGEFGTMQIELRTRGNPEALLPDVRRVANQFGPDLPLLQPMTQQEQFSESFSQERLFARLSIFFGALAALLVAIGLYGALAYRVSRRTSEIGVRMALGAHPSNVLWMVLRESLAVALAGIVVGLPAAIICSRLLRSMLFGLSPNDVATFVVAMAGIVVIALVASAIPATRASGVDPIVALRCE